MDTPTPSDTRSTGCTRVAALADRHYVPVTAHGVGSLVLDAATVHFDASVRNFWMIEPRLRRSTSLGRGSVWTSRTASSRSPRARA